MRARVRQRGMALILVLWVFMVLAVLALDFSAYMRDDAMAAVNFAEETQGYYVALAGMNRALYDALRSNEEELNEAQAGVRQGPNTLDAEEEDPRIPMDGNWHDGEFAGAAYKVRMIDQEGLLPLNYASYELLKQVARYLVLGGDLTAGVDRQTDTDIETIADSIIDWRDPGNTRRPHGAEREYYLAQRDGYEAKNHFFDSPDELLLVRGITPELVYGTAGIPGLRDIFSVHTRSNKVNVRTMPAAVLQALCEITTEEATELVANRDIDPAAWFPVFQGRCPKVFSPELGLEVEGEDHVQPQLVIVEAQADTHAERNRSYVGAVADLSGGDLGSLQIRRWFDRMPWQGALPTPPTYDDGGAR